jgi:hypothetical protein
LTRRLGILYKVPVANRFGWTPVEFSPEDQRDGILTRLSFLMLHSHPGRSSATLRGKAVRELLMCQEVPVPPANVDFALVQNTDNPQFRTARARLARHNDDEVCASCHKLMDPIGLPMENFDSVGQFRTTENGAPIDASGSLGRATFQNTSQMGKVLRDDPQTSSCGVERLFSYATGREVGDRDDQTLERLEAGFKTSGFRFRDLLRQLVTSDRFFTIIPAEKAADVKVASATK